MTSPVPFLTDAEYTALPPSERMLMQVRSQAGTQEIPKGSNWGPMIRLYLAAAGLFTPNPWCGALLVWAAKKAGHPLAHLLSASTVQMYNRARKAGRLSKIPKRGRIGIYHDGRVGHCWIVTRVSGDRLDCIDGNTNDEGSREGYEVCDKRRNLEPLKAHRYWGFVDMEVRDK